MPPLYLELKALRSRLAAEAKVPAFVVFSDMTLRDMCKKMPVTEAELLCVSGIGEAKLRKYGDEVLRLIRKFS